MSPEIAAVRDLRHALWAAGFRPVPVLTNEKKPSPSTGWPERARQDPPESVRFNPVAHVMNTGLLMDALRGVDIDIDDAGLADVIHTIAIELLGADPPIRYRDSSPRRLLLYRAAEGSPPTRSVKGPKGGAQVLGKGSHALSFGIHPDGAELRWIRKPGEINRADLTPVTEEQVTAFLRRAAELLGAEPPDVHHDHSNNSDGEHAPGEPQAPIEKIRDWLSRIPSDDGFEFCNRIGMAIFAATGGSDEGLKAFVEWRGRSNTFDENKVRARWRHYHHSPPASLGAGTLFHEAKRADQARLGEFLDLGDTQVKLPGEGEGEGEGENPEPEPQVGNGEDPAGLDAETAARWRRAAESPPPGHTPRQPEPPDLTVLRLDRRPPPACPLHVFGDRWSGWIESAAQAAASPVDYVVGPLLSAASSLIGNARWAQGPGMSSQWLEPPVLWIASVGDSGEGKTPGANMVMRTVVREIDRRIYGDYPVRHQLWEAERDLAKQKEDVWRADVARSLKAGHQAPPRPADSYPPPEPPRPCWVQNDTTIEKVAANLIGAPKGLFIYRDELAGFLEGMTAYNDSGRQFWLESYGGGRYIVERVKHGNDPIIVEHLTCAIGGGIQPERLAAWFNDNPDDGFASRICWFWPEPLPFRLPRTTCDTGFAVAAFDRLRELELYRHAGELHPILVPLVTTAEQALEAFGRRMQAEQQMTAGLLRSAYGKARGVALRLALVIEFLRWAAGGQALTQGPPTVISVAAFEAACELISVYILPMAARSYGDAALPQAQRNAAMLARWIAKERPPEVHVRPLRRDVRLPGLRFADAIHAACEELIEAQWLFPPTRKGGRGRPPAIYTINPKLWEALSGTV
jgi:hypothetical protein